MGVPDRVRIVVAAVALVAVGCGGGDGGSPVGPSTPPAATPPSAVVEIVGERGAQSFDPNPVTPGATRTVAWRNANGVVHRIVANDGSFDTGNLSAGATSGSIQIPAEGINYHCSLHPTMIGAISGTGGSPPPCTGLYCEDN